MIDLRLSKGSRDRWFYGSNGRNSLQDQASQGDNAVVEDQDFDSKAYVEIFEDKREQEREPTNLPRTVAFF